jgi:hypothetical protein
MLGQLVEALEYGDQRGDVVFHGTVARCLADDAAGAPTGPASYFAFDGGGHAAGGTAGVGGSAQPALEVPALPLPAGGGGRRFDDE